MRLIESLFTRFGAIPLQTPNNRGQSQSLANCYLQIKLIGLMAGRVCCQLGTVIVFARCPSG